MSRTLFWYVFRDLLKVFFLASGALAGIMSFGGLLRPLTEHGLGAGQVLRILGYFMPAMSTYSLPVAALFATTMVYGRLSADNELTACRAAGISYLSIAMPAFFLGLMVASFSFVFIYFFVPVFSLKVDRVIYSNLAQLVANQIERNHRIDLEQADIPITVFAQEAQVLPSPPDDPTEQVVRLVAPMIVTYEGRAKNSPTQKIQPPDEFYMARSATAFIRQDEQSGDVTLQAELDGGLKFPRSTRGTERPGVQVSIGATRFSSEPMPSPVRENTKFMDYFKLRELLLDPEKSRRLKRLLVKFHREDQQVQYLQSLAGALNSPDGSARFDTGSESYVLERGAGTVSIRNGRLTIVAQPDAQPPPRFRQERSGQLSLDASGQEIRVRASPSAPAGAQAPRRMDIDIELIDALVLAGEAVTPRSSFGRSFSVPMSQSLLNVEKNRAAYYLTGPNASAEQRMRLQQQMLKLSNSLVSEMHARASFSVSCLILVLVGCALGMMFKSGNFLSAFAVSVMPAMLCILLIITGQHTCENVPWDIRTFNNPLQFGVAMIWAGNAVVVALAVVLLGRLQRQ
ncbi:MAG: LptF/LptG family permease [Tepidisphaeraceae bacterium]